MFIWCFVRSLNEPVPPPPCWVLKAGISGGWICSSPTQVMPAYTHIYTHNIENVVDAVSSYSFLTHLSQLC